MSNISTWSMDRNLSGATTPGQSEPGSNGNEGVLHILPKLQDWSLTVRWFCVKTRTLIEWEFYLSAEMPTGLVPMKNSLPTKKGKQNLQNL